MKLKFATAFAILTLAGCQTSAPPPPPPPPVQMQPPVAPTNPAEPLVWGRQDCKRATTNPEIVADFSRDKGFCERDAGLKEGDSVNAQMVSCMTDRGYAYRAKSDHDAACSAGAPRRSPAR